MGGSSFINSGYLQETGSKTNKKIQTNESNMLTCSGRKTRRCLPAPHPGNLKGSLTNHSRMLASHTIQKYPLERDKS